MKRQFKIEINALIVLDTDAHEYYAIMDDRVFSTRRFLQVMTYEGTFSLYSADQAKHFIPQRTAKAPDALFIKSLLQWLNFGSCRITVNERIQKFNNSFSY
jgi:hypothetical protein